MNLCIDQGNSSTKIGIFDQDKLLEFRLFEKFSSVEISELFEKFPIDACILSSVIIENDEQVAELKRKCPELIILSHLTPVPIENRYKNTGNFGQRQVGSCCWCFVFEIWK